MAIVVGVSKTKKTIEEVLDEIIEQSDILIPQMKPRDLISALQLKEKILNSDKPIAVRFQWVDASGNGV